MPSLPPLPGFSEVRLTRMFPCRRRQSRRKHVLVRDLAPSTRPADRPTRHVGVTGSPDTQVCVRTFYCWWPGSNGWPPPKAERLRVMFPLCEAATLCPYFHQLLKDHYFKKPVVQKAMAKNVLCLPNSVSFVFQSPHDATFSSPSCSLGLP